jgi:beta-glucosidase
MEEEKKTPVDIRAKSPAMADGEWWAKRFEEKREEIRAGGGSSVVFIGDSITHNWENAGKAVWEKYFAGAPYHALQLGFGGDRTEHLLWRIDHGELDGYEAKAIILAIGTNNTGHEPKEPPADTILGIKAVVDRLLEKQPKARVILHPVFPRGEFPDDPNRRQNAVVNREIMKLADGRRVVWCDINPQFLLPDGRLPKTLVPDFLHPGPMGYELWANGVMPLIDRILAAKPGQPVASVFGACQESADVTDENRESLIPQTRIEFDAAGAGNWWYDRLAANRRQIAQSGGKIDLVFMGDSITHYWDVGEGLDTSTEIVELRKKFSILNCGYGGDQTQHLLWRAKYGELDGYEAKLVMLLIGTNNSGAGCPPEEIFDAIRELVSVIHVKQPRAKILLLKLFPRNTAKSPANVRNQAVNAMIGAATWDDDVIVRDLTPVFADADGNAIPELFDNEILHMSDEGFVRWRRAVEPIFDEVCGGR